MANMMKNKSIKKDPNAKVPTVKDHHESGTQKRRSSLPKENSLQMLFKPKSNEEDKKPNEESMEDKEKEEKEKEDKEAELKNKRLQDPKLVRSKYD